MPKDDEFVYIKIITIPMSVESYGLIHEELRVGTRVESDSDVVRNAFQTYLAMFRERYSGKRFATIDADGNVEEFVISEFEDIDPSHVKQSADDGFPQLRLVVSNEDPTDG